MPRPRTEAEAPAAPPASPPQQPSPEPAAKNEPSPDVEARLDALETGVGKLADRILDRLNNIEDSIEQIQIRLAKVENNPGLHLVVDKTPAPQASSCGECGATDPMHWDHCSKFSDRPRATPRTAEKVTADA